MRCATAAAIETGASVVEAETDGGTRTRDLSSLQCELDFLPKTSSVILAHPLLFSTPQELNVPVENAFDIVRSLWAAGGRRWVYL